MATINQLVRTAQEAQSRKERRTGPAELSAATRCVYSRLYDNAEEAKLRTA